MCHLAFALSIYISLNFSCTPSCNATRDSFTPPPYFEGFSLGFVSIVYVILIAFTVGLFYVCKRIGQKKQEEEINAGEGQKEVLNNAKLE